MFRPSKNDWNEILKTILKKISQERCLVSIDSLNGLSSFFEEKDAGRLLDSYLMMLGSIASQTKSNVLFVSIARRQNDEGWVLSPSGRRVLEASRVTKLYLKKNHEGLTAEFLNEDNSINTSILII